MKGLIGAQGSNPLTLQQSLTHRFKGLSTQISTAQSGYDSHSEKAKKQGMIICGDWANRINLSDLGILKAPKSSNAAISMQ
jgi:hypothetical protein